MAQRVIPCAVTGEYVAGDGVTLGAAGSHNSVVIEYDFRAAGPQWEGTTKYVLWTNPTGTSTNRVDLGADTLVDGYTNVYHAAPTADAMCTAGWCEMSVVGVTVSGDMETQKIKTEPCRFRVLPATGRESDNEGVAATVADQLQTEIEAVNRNLDDRKVNKPVSPDDPDGKPGQVLSSLGDGKTKWVDFDKSEVEAVLAAHPEWTTTVQDGAISRVKLSADLDDAIFHGCILNAADFVDGLTANNLQTAIDNALEVGPRVYVPAGDYAVSLAFEDKRLELYLDDGCVITPKNTGRAIDALDCEIVIHGGTFYEGTDEFGAINSETRLESSDKAIVAFRGCKNSGIEKAKFLHSHRAGMLGINRCVNTFVDNCSFKNMLHCGVTIGGSGNQNIRVANCRFENSYVFSYYDDGTLKTQGYCYFVSTGGGALNSSADNTYIPPDQLVYENNYCINSEDCGLDTHGATNVTIRNNTVLDTICAITAYNDNRRMYRPKVNKITGQVDNVNGIPWTMHDILIENNWCESTKIEKTGYNTWPHPYIFLGASNGHSTQTADYAHNPGTYDAFMNCVVQNNYFRSPNNTGVDDSEGLMNLGAMSRNVSVRNNYFDCVNGASPVTMLKRVIGFEFIDNIVKNAHPVILVIGSIGKFFGNQNVRAGWFNGAFYVNGQPNLHQYFLARHDIYYNTDTERVFMSMDEGIRPYSNSMLGGINADTRTFDITVEDGVAYRDLPSLSTTQYSLIPDLAFSVEVNGVDVIYTVRDVIDRNRFILVDENRDLLPDGNYSDIVMVTANKAEIATVSE